MIQTASLGPLWGLDIQPELRSWSGRCPNPDVGRGVDVDVIDGDVDVDVVDDVARYGGVRAGEV